MCLDCNWEDFSIWARRQADTYRIRKDIFHDILDTIEETEHITEKQRTVLDNIVFRASGGREQYRPLALRELLHRRQATNKE